MARPAKLRSTGTFLFDALTGGSPRGYRGHTPTSEGPASARLQPVVRVGLRLCSDELRLHVIDRPPGRHRTLGSLGSDLVHPADDMEAEMPGTEVAQ